MRTLKIITLTVTGGLLLLLALIFWPAPNRPFAKYVYSPTPRTVRVISFQSNDWLAANPEPVCYLRFTASPDDIATVVRQGGFQPASTNGSVPVPTGGPAGWLPADQIGPSGRVYTRLHRAAGGGLHIGRNRIWSEFLWIDGTGTNVYFLLWGV
jgi:hypothetical protein